MTHSGGGESIFPARRLIDKSDQWPFRPNCRFRLSNGCAVHRLCSPVWRSASRHGVMRTPCRTVFFRRAGRGSCKDAKGCGVLPRRGLVDHGWRHDPTSQEGKRRTCCAFPSYPPPPQLSLHQSITCFFSLVHVLIITLKERFKVCLSPIFFMSHLNRDFEEFVFVLFSFSSISIHFPFESLSFHLLF